MALEKHHIDWYILLSVLGLMFFSIAFVYSASASYAELKFGSREALFWNQILRVFIGILVLIFTAKIDYHFWMKYSKPLIIFSIFLLVIVLLFGVNVKGASRWINLKFVRFQPSELAKLALVLHLATLLTKNQDVIKDFKQGMLPLLIWTGILSILIILQPNLSTVLVIVFISIVMMFVGNNNLLHLFALGISSLGLSAILVIVKSDYRLHRIIAFFSGSDIAENLESYSYQLQQSLIAFGNGGFWGVGPGLSRQSNLFLPESYGDFIYSIIGEEYGFIGASIIILIFGFILWRAMIIAKNAPDNFGYYVSIGIIFTLALNAFVNAGVNTGLLPTTGLPMPFVSYGGTAVIFHSAAIGILLNISSQAGIYPKKKSLIQ